MTWRSLEAAELPLEGRVDSWRIGWSHALRPASIRRLTACRTPGYQSVGRFFHDPSRCGSVNRDPAAS
jgi:hypothetical protein